MPHDTQLTSVDHADTKPDHTEYRSLVGGLNYIAMTTRADVAWTVHQLAKHMANKKTEKKVTAAVPAAASPPAGSTVYCGSKTAAAISSRNAILSL